MGQVKVTKKDILWSYIAQFFNIGAGLITLPLILHKLSADEIGLNYLMITVSTLVGLLDFGFSPQFSRNITYVFSGVDQLKKEGVSEAKEGINPNLLNNMIEVAKMVYSRLAVIALLLMLTAGTYYIYEVTEGFSTVKFSLPIWLIYSISVYFNIYFTYYASLLTGRGQIKESKQAMMAQRILYIVLTYTMVLYGLGLFGVVLANLLAPFLGRFLSYRFFYDAEIKSILYTVSTSKEEKLELFKTIWYNAKKLGLVYVGSYAINKFSIFIAGLFLSLEEIASYGLMIQVFSIVSTLAATYNGAAQPLFAAYRTQNDKASLIKTFARTMVVFYTIIIIGSVGIIVVGPLLLAFIKSNAILPSACIMSLYAIILLLENNHSSFAGIIVSGNKIPFVESSLISGFAICLLSYLSLRYTTLGLLGLILVQGLCQLVYSNWKWPYVVCKQFGISYPHFIKIGVSQYLNKIR